MAFKVHQKFNRFPSCSSDPVISGENVDLNMTSPFKVGFLKSEILPFDTLKSCKLVLNHKGTVNNFKSTAHVQVNSKNANGVITFSSMNGIQGTSKIIPLVFTVT
jgi:hypothetical protein